MNAREYAEQLAQAAGLSQEEKDSFLKVVSNEKLAKSLEEGVMLRSDYSRQSDKLKQETDKASKYYADLLTWKAEQERVLAEASGQQQVVQQVQPDFTAFQEKLNKSWEEKLQQRDGQFLGLLKVGMNIASRHAVEFKEPLDTTAVEKIAIEKPLPLAQAYDAYVAPRRTEFQAAQRKLELDTARAEAVRDFASTHKIPVDARPREFHTLLDRDPKKQVGIDDYVPNSAQLSQRANAQLAENFADSWNSATAGTSGSK